MLVSSSSSRALRVGLGDRLELTGRGGSAAYPIGAVRVVGIYQPFDAGTDYWFDRAYASQAGVVHEPQGDLPDLLHSDALLLSPAGIAAFEAARRSATAGSSTPFRYFADLPVPAGRITIDGSRQLVRAVQGIQARIDAAHPAGDPNRGSVRSALVPPAAAGRRRPAAEPGDHSRPWPSSWHWWCWWCSAWWWRSASTSAGPSWRWPGCAASARAPRPACTPARSRVLVGRHAGPRPAAGLAGLPGAVPMVAAGRRHAGVALAGAAGRLAVAVVEVALAVLLARRTAGQPIGQLLRTVGPRRPAGLPERPRSRWRWRPLPASRWH